MYSTNLFPLLIWKEAIWLFEPASAIDMEASMPSLYIRVAYLARACSPITVSYIYKKKQACFSIKRLPVVVTIEQRMIY